MNSKYPAFFQLLVIIGKAIGDAEEALKPGQGILQRLLGFEDLVPELIKFLPEASKISGEIKAMGPDDYVAAAEQLVAELAIDNAKAQAVLAASFPIVHDLAAMAPKVENLIKALKS